MTSFTSVKAAAAPAGCPSSYFCFWVNAGYSDGPGKLSGKNSDWSAFGHSSCPSGTWNDCASSDYNNGVSCDAVVWTGKSYGGTGGWVPKGTGGNFNSTFNDAVSSNSWGVYATGGTNSTCTGPVP
ncbi:peptidase inhibitor family I36 protein [Streptomyces sp. NPDC050625]|uniref:peptidase inhibitor family I36 protein n=1 Tax=Streptomyces sp. NPDC050625 TaxID=3154629 RepID=UPI00342CBEE2